MVKVDLTFIDSVLDKHGHSKTKAIAIMQDVQNEYKFLPKDALSYISEKLGMSEAELYGVATFYVRKSDDVQEALYTATGMKPEDHMSEDGLFTIERVSCLGACGLAPVCTVNDVVHPAMTPEKMYKLIAELREAEGV